jgi:hypothetical protein
MSRISLPKFIQDTPTDGVVVPPGVEAKFEYLDWWKTNKFLSENPERYLIIHNQDGEEVRVDMYGSIYNIRKYIEHLPKKEKEVLEQKNRLWKTLQTKRGFLMKRWSPVAGKDSPFNFRKTELLQLFGSLHSLEEVYGIMRDQMGTPVSMTQLKNFYQRNYEKIERMRMEYESHMTDDIPLTKKRSRLDKLSYLFHLWFKRFKDLPTVEKSREIRAVLADIRKEVEGERLILDITGKIDIDLTVQANQSLRSTLAQIPLNSMIVGLVAARAGIDPGKIMHKLNKSYYSRFSGYSKEGVSPEETIDVRDMIYNWDEIRQKHSIKVTDIEPIEEEKPSIKGGLGKKSLLDLVNRARENAELTTRTGGVCEDE